MGRRVLIGDQPAEFLGRVEANRSVPTRWLRPPAGQKVLLLADERDTTYVYQAPASTTQADIRSWTSTTFPFGCSVTTVVHNSSNRKRVIK